MDDRATASWRRHYGSVYRFVRRRSPSREDAEDVTQEVFEAAATALAKARLDAEPPLAWLYAVARRRLVDRLRIPAAQQTPLNEGAFVDDRGERAYAPAIVQALVEGLRSLDEGQRRVVVSKLFEGRSFAEIAAELEVSEEACRMRFSRGLARLRHQLEEKGVTP